MFRKVLVIIAGVLNLLWGISHLFPTYSVVTGFGEISIDNKNIILMEWINEGLTLIFVGILIISVTVFTKENSRTLKIVYLLTALMLFAMAALSLFTGFNIDFLPFKLCPFIFSVSAILIFQGIFRK